MPKALDPAKPLPLPVGEAYAQHRAAGISKPEAWELASGSDISVKGARGAASLQETRPGCKARIRWLLEHEHGVTGSEQARQAYIDACMNTLDSKKSTLPEKVRAGEALNKLMGWSDAPTVPPDPSQMDPARFAEMIRRSEAAHGTLEEFQQAYRSPEGSKRAPVADAAVLH